MLFNSLDFAIFFPIVLIFYWIVADKKNHRNLLLLVASYVFYGWWDWRFLFLIVVSSLVDYLVGKQLFKTENATRRKLLLWISLGVNLGFLLYFKYANFFIESFIDAFSLFGKDLEASTLNIILPVGISFYTFQTLSYTLDIYRKKLEPSKDALAFFSFVSFFPQLVAGPIERASHLLPQFYQTYKFDYDRVRSGLLLVAFGLFKKMVIADQVAVLANQVFNNPGDYGGYEVVVGTIFFAFQIYCDFSGYSDIAIGLSRMMGFNLMKNFDSPYLSKSITEFWRRWHISLSTWFRDYVYISMGGNRKGKFRMYFNLFFVFIVSGLWHGAAMTFIIWGAVHGAIIVLEKALSKWRERIFVSVKLNRETVVSKLLFISITFTIVCFAWIFFRANNLSDAITLISNLRVNNYSTIFDGGLFDLGVDKYQFYAIIISILLLSVFEIYHRRFGVVQKLFKQHIIVRWFLYLAIVFVITIFGVYGDAAPKEFIYFQF
jgi:D-alanyl-lipoteichoic acid acyltransferase DltB (MBOAT superfamily)